MNDIVKKKSIGQWKDYIGNSLKKTAQATLETAVRIAEFKAATEEDKFVKHMKEFFNFTPTHLSYWKSINEAMPRFENNVGSLPAGTRTLYELSNIKDDLWDELIETKDINPSVTVEGAKTMKSSGGILRKIADKFAEANNFLEIMQSAKLIKDESDTIKEFKKEFNLWLKENPADFEEMDTEDSISGEHEMEFDENGNIIEDDDPQPAKKAEPKEEPKPTGTSPAVRAKCLALFGIFVDKPIIDKDFLTFLDIQAGNDDTKIAAIATLEGE